MLKIAVPNGSLEEQTLQLFRNAGIVLGKNHRRYEAEVNDPRIARIFFMRPHIIPYLVGRGCYDLGITGSDCVAEADDCPVAVLAKLRYSGARGHDWRLVFLGGEDDPATSLKDIEDDVTVLTEYPRITQTALGQVGKQAKIHFSRGSTEAHIPHDFPYGVCIASSGTTLKENRLKITEVLSVETAVIIGSPNRVENRDKERTSLSLLDDLLR